MKSIVTKVILLMLIMVSLSLIVSAVPSTMPQAFYGTISGASAGITINAVVSSINKGSFTLTETGVYGCAAASCGKLVVCSDESCTSGDTISFTASSGSISTTTTYAAGATTELNLAYTAPSSTTTSSGGGGGGGGGGTTTTTTAAAVKETSVVSSISAGGSATFVFSKSADLGITQITITSKNSVASPSITVEEKTWTGTAAIDASSGGVYKYLDITPAVITVGGIEKAVINFKVPSSWFSSGNYDPQTVKLKKEAGSSWNSVTTKLTSSDSSYYYYEAESASLSVYAITAEKKAAAQPPAPSEKEEKPAKPEIPFVGGKGIPFTGIIIIAVILAIGVVAYLLYSKKKK